MPLVDDKYHLEVDYEVYKKFAFGLQLLPQQQQQQQRRQQENAVAKQRPQTLDLLFANMKEQRMRAQPPRQNNAVQQRNRGQPRLPWGRGGRFGN